MESAEKIQSNRLGVWLAPIIALIWIAVLLLSLALLLWAWSLVKIAWHL